MANGFRPDQRITRKALNDQLKEPPKINLKGPRVSSRRGSTVIANEELIKLKITEVGTNPTRYGWKEVYHDKETHTWQDANRTGSITSDPAFSLGSTVLTVGNQVYEAKRDRASGAWILVQGGGGGGSLQTKGKDILLLLLGTFDEYKNCPDVPPDPPKKANGELCEPAYAWAAYKICGYKFTKLFDARAYGTWANELNGETAAGWYRMHPAFFGWDDYADGQPSGDEACAGVRFIKTGAGALTCSCPAWVENVNCLKLTFKTIPRPCPTDPNCGYQCGTLWTYMDGNMGQFPPLWDTEFTLIACKVGGCSFTVYAEHFSVEIDFEEIPRGAPECFWGPAEIDPCKPCDAFGRWYMKIEGNWGGNNQGNCQGTGLVTAYFDNSVMANALIDCEEGLPYSLKECNQCDTDPPTNTYLHVIDPDSIKVTCCTEEEAADCLT